MSKKKIFIDTDIFLDTTLQREPYSRFADKLIGLCERNEIIGYTSSLVIANIYYIINRFSTHKKAVDAVRKIRSIITVLPFTDKEIGESLNSVFKDFEDGAQYFIAVNHNISCLVTRNTKDFKKADITILSPEEYLQSADITKNGV